MKIAKIFFVIILSVLSYSLVFAEEHKSFEQLYYGRFSKIKGFRYIEVNLDKSKEIELSKNELTDYVKLKFRNNFRGIQILTDEQVVKMLVKGRGEKLGYIWFDVFIRGDTDYPVVYYVQCRAGNLKHFSDNLPAPIQQNSIIWEKAYIGFCRKINVSEKIKKVINGLIEELAIDFFKARSEL